MTSFIGAAVLWWLTVGPVRGFALFLGLSTVLDVVVTWFYTRPVVIAASTACSPRCRSWASPGLSGKKTHRSAPRPRRLGSGR